MEKWARDTIESVRDYINDVLSDVVPYRAIVDSLSSGRVTIQRIRATSPDNQLYSRIAGFDVAEGDEVYVLPLNGKPVIIGKIQREAPTGFSLEAPLTIPSLAFSNGVLIKTGTGSPEGAITAPPGSLFLRTNGSAGTTVYKKVSGSGNTGWETLGEFVAPTVGVKSQTAADATSTTSTSTNSVAMTLTITLPAGTWTVRALGFLGIRHSAGGAARIVTVIGGTEGTARTPDGPTTGYRMVTDDATVTGISGGGNVDVTIEFRSSDAGTTSVNNPGVIAIAQRTA